VNDRIIRQLDINTGELLEGCLVYVPYRPKFQAGWFMIFQDMLVEMAKDREMTGETCRVLFYLLGKMDFENYVRVTQGDAAAALGLQKTNVSRAVKTLCDKGILLKGPKAGRSATYRLNSAYGWKGKVKNFESERRQRFKLLNGGKDADPAQEGGEEGSPT
jgi:DNA-binding MarR family transcriptional regulator